MLNDQKNGIFKTYYPNGSLEKEYSLKDGSLLNGSYAEHFYKDGKLYIKLSGTYIEEVQGLVYGKSLNFKKKVMKY